MCRLQQKQEATLLHICGQQMQPYSHMSPAQGKQLTEPKWQTNNPTQINQTETKTKVNQTCDEINPHRSTVRNCYRWAYIHLGPTHSQHRECSL